MRTLYYVSRHQKINGPKPLYVAKFVSATPASPPTYGTFIRTHIRHRTHELFRTHSVISLYLHRHTHTHMYFVCVRRCQYLKFEVFEIVLEILLLNTFHKTVFHTLYFVFKIILLVH